MLRRSYRWLVLLILVSVVFIFQYFFEVNIIPPVGEPIFAAEERSKRKVDPQELTKYGGGLLAAEDETLDLQKARKALVIASLRRDDTAWIGENFPDWEQNIYVVDKPARSQLSVKKNKGREANVYLTYMIDHYDHLPDFVLFAHAERYQWHNEDPMYDAVPVIQNLRLQHVQAAGFVNTRCTWALGCPAELQDLHLGADKPVRTDRPDLPQEEYYAEAFKLLFPEKELPRTVGAPCCAQFAVSKEAILARPKKDYVRFRNWLWDSHLPDSTSGRVIEYSWHIMFGKEATHCPSAEDCFCRTYGLCNLTCPNPGSCDKRYILPQTANIPRGWPNSGVEGTKGFPAKDWYL